MPGPGEGTAPADREAAQEKSCVSRSRSISNSGPECYNQHRSQPFQEGEKKLKNITVPRLLTRRRRSAPRAAGLFLLLLFLAPAALAEAANAARTVVVLRPPGNRTVARFSVEIADRPALWVRGLMDRKHLPPDAGMFFIFQHSKVQSFWMMNTLLPLDMIFADSRGRINTIWENVPPCLPPHRCPTYESTAPSLYVLEVNGGTARKKGIRIGDRLQLR